MCNRFNLQFTKPTTTKFKWVQLLPDPSLFDDFLGTFSHLIRPEYKPMDSIFHLRANSSDSSNSKISEPFSITHHFDTWGAKPDWSKKPITNSRSEKLFSSSFWKPFVVRNRCLVPATCFYEWQEIHGKKVKKEISFLDFSTCLAGIYGKWEDIGIPKPGVWLTILTQEGNPLMKQIHNSGENQGRQPVVMREKYWEKWLSPNVNSQNEILAMIEKFGENEIDVGGTDPGENQPGLFPNLN